jgi:ribosomal protein L18
MEGGQAKPRARYVRADGGGEAGGGWEVTSWPTLVAIVLGLALGLAGTITGSWAVHRALTHDTNDRAWVADYVQVYTKYHAGMTQFLNSDHCQALKNNNTTPDTPTACDNIRSIAEDWVDWSGLEQVSASTTSDDNGLHNELVVVRGGGTAPSQTQYHMTVFRSDIDASDYVVVSSSGTELFYGTSITSTDGDSTMNSSTGLGSQLAEAAAEAGTDSWFFDFTGQTYHVKLDSVAYGATTTYSYYVAQGAR